MRPNRRPVVAAATLEPTTRDREDGVAETTEQEGTWTWGRWGATRPRGWTCSWGGGGGGELDGGGRRRHASGELDMQLRRRGQGRADRPRGLGPGADPDQPSPPGPDRPPRPRGVTTPPTGGAGGKREQTR